VWAIGVDPAHQGEGIGRLLLAPILRAADGAGLPVYLETEEPATVAFYQRLGFRTRAHADVGGGALRIMAMLRPPVPVL
jgi:GNAT superfamily N-acetyltransferase